MFKLIIAQLDPMYCNMKQMASTIHRIMRLGKPDFYGGIPVT